MMEQLPQSAAAVKKAQALQVCAAEEDASL
jgi:hypothetical protein